MSTVWKRAGGVFLVVALIAAAAFWRYYDKDLRYWQETNDATIEADQVTISSRLAGYVRQVLVDDNQTVGKGALLVEIEPDDYQTRLATADADIASAVAARAQEQAAGAEAKAAVAAAEADLQAARTSFDYAKREAERYRPLVEKGAEPAATLSQLTTNRDRAAADVAARQAAVEEAHRRIDTIAAQGAQQAAHEQSARVQRQAAAHDLAATHLVAPIAGRIAGRSVRVGQFVQPGVRLLTIVPEQDLYVVANFKETQVGLMRPGQPVSVRVDALPGVEFHGQVASITPGTGANFSLIPPQNATGNFTKVIQRVPVRIRIAAGPAARRVLAPGLSLEVEVDTRAAAGDLDAIRAEQEHAASAGSSATPGQ